MIDRTPTTTTGALRSPCCLSDLRRADYVTPCPPPGFTHYCPWCGRLYVFATRWVKDR